MSDKKQLVWTFVIFGVVVVLSLVYWVVSSSFEAEAFNRLTGKDATTWDAMWVQLRVQ